MQCGHWCVDCYVWRTSSSKNSACTKQSILKGQDLLNSADSWRRSSQLFVVCKILLSFCPPPPREKKKTQNKKPVTEKPTPCHAIYRNICHPQRLSVSLSPVPRALRLISLRSEMVTPKKCFPNCKRLEDSDFCGQRSQYARYCGRSRGSCQCSSSLQHLRN